jgi:hypothetical protein
MTSKSDSKVIRIKWAPKLISGYDFREYLLGGNNMKSDDKYKRSMIEYIKVIDLDIDEDVIGKILTILRKAELFFIRTSAYTNRNNQFYEFAELRVPIPLLDEAKDYQDVFEEVCREFYIESDEYAFSNLSIKPLTLENNIETAEHDVIFSKIREEIIQGIRSAKHLIWAAVAWISDDIIINELILKKKEGVQVKLITSNEESNKWRMKTLKQNFDMVLIDTYGDKDWNRMHNKFCIIDLEYVMHGSYNWSQNAGKNKETLATALDRDFVSKFADEFIRLCSTQ